MPTPQPPDAPEVPSRDDSAPEPVPDDLALSLDALDYEEDELVTRYVLAGGKDWYKKFPAEHSVLQLFDWETGAKWSVGTNYGYGEKWASHLTLELEISSGSAEVELRASKCSKVLEVVGQCDQIRLTLPMNYESRHTLLFLKHAGEWATEVLDKVQPHGAESRPPKVDPNNPPLVRRAWGSFSDQFDLSEGCPPEFAALARAIVDVTKKRPGLTAEDIKDWITEPAVFFPYENEWDSFVLRAVEAAGGDAMGGIYGLQFYPPPQ